MKVTKFWQCCFNPKILISLSVVAVAVAVLFRNQIHVVELLPWLLVLVCPLSMIVMMVMMKDKNHTPNNDDKK